MKNEFINTKLTTKKSKIETIIKILEKEYPNVKCELIYNTPLELLIAARLSAQCTDKKVNSVTPHLFSKFKSVKDFANAEKSDIEKIIKPCGLYKTKSLSIILACKKIVSDFNGEIPCDMEDLVSLPGIGRKTANLIRGEIFGKPAIIVDTHFSRITKRLGFHNLENPVKIEFEMKKIVPEEKSLIFCHLIVFHGRNICKSRNPLCKRCALFNLCTYKEKNLKGE